VVGGWDERFRTALSKGLQSHSFGMEAGRVEKSPYILWLELRGSNHRAIWSALGGIHLSYNVFILCITTDMLFRYLQQENVIHLLTVHPHNHALS